MAFYFLLRIAMVLQLAVVVDANNFTNNSNSNSNINNSTNGIVWSNGNGTNSGNSTNATGGDNTTTGNQFVPDHAVMVRDFLLLILLVGLVPGFCCYRLNKLNNDDNTTNNHIDRTEQQQQPQQQQREVRKESAAQRKEFVKTQLPVRILQEKDVLLSSSNKRGLENDNKSDDGDTEEEDDDLDDVELGVTNSGHSNRSLATGGSRRNVLNHSRDQSAKIIMIGVTGGTSHDDDTNDTRAVAAAATAAAVVASNNDMSSSSPDTNLISSIRESFARLGSSGSTGGIVALASSCRPMATAAALSSSSQWSVMSGTRPVCSICLSGYHRGDEVSCATNPHCPHVFHHECIESWLYNHDECPNCRQEFLLRPPATTTTTEATTKEPTITTEAAATEPTATTTITTEAATNNNTTPVLLSPPIFISQV